MKWLWKLVWRMKSDEQILIAKYDALFWIEIYQGDVASMKRKAIYRWNTFILPELKRRNL